MLGLSRAVQPAPDPSRTPPPAPAPLHPDERAELARVRRRLSRKWAAMDALVADFADADRIIGQ